MSDKNSKSPTMQILKPTFCLYWRSSASTKMMGDTNYSKCFCIANEKVAIKMAAKEVGQGRLQEIADFLSESYIL